MPTVLALLGEGLSCVYQCHQGDPYQDGGPVASLPWVSQSLVALGENTVHRSWFPEHDWSPLLRSVVPGVSFSGFQLDNGSVGAWGP